LNLWPQGLDPDSVQWLWQDPLPSVEDIYLQDSDGFGRVYGKGKRKGKQEDVREFLALRFGEQSVGIQEMVKELTDLDTLSNVVRELFPVNTLEGARNVIIKGIQSQQVPKQDT